MLHHMLCLSSVFNVTPIELRQFLTSPLLTPPLAAAQESPMLVVGISLVLLFLDCLRGVESTSRESVLVLRLSMFIWCWIREVTSFGSSVRLVRNATLNPTRFLTRANRLPSLVLHVGRLCVAGWILLAVTVKSVFIRFLTETVLSPSVIFQLKR